MASREQARPCLAAWLAAGSLGQWRHYKTGGHWWRSPCPSRHQPRDAGWHTSRCSGQGRRKPAVQRSAGGALRYNEWGAIRTEHVCTARNWVGQPFLTSAWGWVCNPGPPGPGSEACRWRIHLPGRPGCTQVGQSALPWVFTAKGAKKKRRAPAVAALATAGTW